MAHSHPPCFLIPVSRPDLVYVLAFFESLKAVQPEASVVCGCVDDESFNVLGAFEQPGLSCVRTSRGFAYTKAAENAPQGAPLVAAGPKIWAVKPMGDVLRGATCVLCESGPVCGVFQGSAAGRSALETMAAAKPVPGAGFKKEAMASFPWKVGDASFLDFSRAVLIMHRLLVVEERTDAPLTMELLKVRYLPWARTVVGMAEAVRRADPDYQCVEPSPDWLGPRHVFFASTHWPMPLVKVPQKPVQMDGAMVYVPSSLPGARHAQDARQGDEKVLSSARQHLAQGRFEEAAKGFDAVLSESAHVRLAVSGLLDVLETCGDNESFLQVCTHYLDAYPDDAGVRARGIAAVARDLDQTLLTCERDETGFRPRDFRVSALVSTYASQEFMEECLTDLQGQTIADDVEIIIVDAASPEDERSVVRRFQQRHDNIRYVRTPERIGIYRAWNLALRLATGRYHTPFSTNDRLAPDAYEVLSSALESDSGASLVFGDSHLTEKPHEVFGEHTFTTRSGGVWVWPEYSFEYNLASCTGGPHPMWRGDVIKRYGFFDERYTALSDQDFFLRLGRLGLVRHVPRFTGLAWLSDSALSDETKTQKELLEIRARFGAVHTADVCALTLLPGVMAELEALVNEKGMGKAAEKWRLIRSNLPDDELVRDLDGLFLKQAL